MRTVLFIDGPLKGRVLPCDRPPQYLPERENGVLSSFTDFVATIEPIEPRTYYFHRISLFGRMVWLGSVGADVLQASNSAHLDDLWELLISSAAKLAVEPQ
jgi:hypothetical protein